MFIYFLFLFFTVEVVEKKVDVAHENELVLDGGFVVPKKVDVKQENELALDSGFVVSDNNAFGHIFR